MSFPLIYLRQADFFTYITLNPSDIQNADIEIDYGGGVKEGSISSGGLSLTVKKAVWDLIYTSTYLEKSYPRHHIFVDITQHVEGHQYIRWLGVVDIPNMTYDPITELISFEAYGVLDYLDQVEPSNLWDDPPYYSKEDDYKGRLIGANGIFVPNNPNIRYRGEFYSYGRKVFFKNKDPYTRQSSLDGEYTIKSCGFWSGEEFTNSTSEGYVVAFLIDGLPEPPVTELIGDLKYDDIGGNRINLKVETTTNSSLGMLTPADRGSTVSLRVVNPSNTFSDTYNGDYEITHIDVPSPYYQYIYIGIRDKSEFDSLPNGVPCKISIRTWRTDGLDYYIEPKIMANISLESMLSSMLAKLPFCTHEEGEKDPDFVVTGIHYPAGTIKDKPKLFTKGFHIDPTITTNAGKSIYPFKNDYISNIAIVTLQGSAILHVIHTSTGSNYESWVKTSSGKKRSYPYLYNFTEDRGSYAHTDDWWQNNSAYSAYDTWNVISIIYSRIEKEGDDTILHVWVELRGQKTGYSDGWCIAEIVANMDIESEQGYEIEALLNPYVKRVMNHISTASPDSIIAENPYYALASAVYYWKDMNDQHICSAFYWDTTSTDKLYWCPINLNTMSRHRSPVLIKTYSTGTYTTTTASTAIYSDACILSTQVYLYEIDLQSTYNTGVASISFEEDIGHVISYISKCPYEGTNPRRTIFLLWIGAPNQEEGSYHTYDLYNNKYTNSPIPGNRWCGAAELTYYKGDMYWTGFWYKDDYEFSDDAKALELHMINADDYSISPDDQFDLYTNRPRCPPSSAPFFVGVELVSETYEKDDDGCSRIGALVNIHHPTVVHSPNIRDMTSREIVEHCVELLCSTLEISYKSTPPRRWTYTVTAKLYESTPYLIDSGKIIGNVEYKPYNINKVTHIEMGSYTYPYKDSWAYHRTRLYDYTESIFGDWIDSDLLAENVGDLWLRWLSSIKGHISFRYKWCEGISIGNRIQWEGHIFVVTSISINVTSLYMDIEGEEYVS